MRDNRYDVWKCAKCGAERVVRSVPHNPPTCCGTGMWFQELRLGASYDNGVEPVTRDEHEAMGKDVTRHRRVGRGDSRSPEVLPGGDPNQLSWLRDV
jgi:hypothetical protein